MRVFTIHCSIYNLCCSCSFHHSVFSLRIFITHKAFYQVYSQFLPSFLFSVTRSFIHTKHSFSPTFIQQTLEEVHFRLLGAVSLIIRSSSEGMDRAAFNSSTSRFCFSNIFSSLVLEAACIYVSLPSNPSRNSTFGSSSNIRPNSLNRPGPPSSARCEAQAGIQPAWLLPRRSAAPVWRIE